MKQLRELSIFIYDKVLLGIFIVVNGATSCWQMVTSEVSHGSV